MKELIRHSLPYLFCLAVLTAPIAIFAQSPTKPNAIPSLPARAVNPIKLPKTPNTAPALDDPRTGDIQLLDSQQVFHEADLQREMSPFEAKSKTISVHSKSDNKLLMIAAPSANKSLHFPSAYLLGRAPYKVTERWMPLYIISEKIHYQLDNEHFPGREEVWLTTMQTWKQAHGDCEDHAILLADWLIELGLDARVVIGQHNSSGHAWVVVIKDGNEYLLEATLKNYLERWAAYPLTKLLPEYHPAMMFNRDDLWVNSGSKLTTSYSTDKWKKTLHFSAVH